MNSMSVKRYSELVRFDSFKDRFSYLKLSGIVGKDTFGFDRYLNQMFYRTTQWRDVRLKIIARDNGCDLGVPGHQIYDSVIIHHMNPLTLQELKISPDVFLNPEFLICVSHSTHNAIHYGIEDIPRPMYAERKPGDTNLW